MSRKVLHVFREIRSKVNIDRRFVSFLFFLGIAIVFWFLNTLGKDYTTSLVFPVKYTHLPPEIKLVSHPPEQLTLKVQGNGFKLLQHKLNWQFDSFPVRVNQLEKKYHSDDSSYLKIPSTNLHSIINNRLAPQITVLAISPDTLHFYFSEVHHKRVPIKPHLKVDFKRQYMKTSDVELTPDTITIKGPKQIIDTIQTLHTKTIQLSNVDQSKHYTAELKTIQQVQYSTRKVDLYLPVQRFTEAEITVPVQAVHLPDSLDIKMFPHEININYFVGLEDYNKVHPDQFNAYVDYQSVLDDTTHTLPIHLKDSSRYARSVSYSPQQVEYIIEKK